MCEPAAVLSPARRYAAALLCTTLGLAARVLIDPLIGDALYFVTAFPAVAATVWIAGTGPGIATALACLLWAGFYFAPPRGSLDLSTARQWFAAITYLASSGVIVAMGHALNRARERSQRAELELRTMTDSLPALVSHIGPDFTYRLNNQAYEDWFGLERSKIHGQKMREVLGEEAFAKIEPRLKQALAGETVSFTDYLPYTRNGGRWVRVTYVPFQNAAGRTDGLVAMVMDITAQHQAECSLAEREREFRAIFELNATGSAECDAQSGQFLRVNGKFCEMLGYSSTELLGLTFAEITHPEDLPRDREVFRAALQSRAAQWESEKRFVRRDGSEVWALVRGTILREASGHAVRTIASVIDLTEWRNIQHALRESETRLRLALDAGKFGAWEWNIEQDKVVWSERLYEIHGLAREDFDGTVRGFARLVHPDDLAKVNRAIEQSLKHKAPYELEFRAVRPGGQIVWIWTAALVLNHSSQPARMIGITADVTARKRNEELLRSQAQHLEELVQARTARLQEVITELEGFSYSVAHDLRAPLRSMHGFASLLREDCASKLDAQSLEFLDRIAQSAERMDDLIQDVLSYSRVTRDQIALQPMDPAELLKETIRAHPEFQPPFAEIELRCPMPRVMASTSLLSQCFSNLLGNAVKFVAPGDKPAVQVLAAMQEGMVRLSFRDNGIGIAPEHHGRVFGLFDRLDQNYSGTGIGLAIVKRAVDRMGGRVGLESALGQGSCFWVELKPAEPGPAA